MFSCFICKARFTDRNECKQHMQSHTRKESNPKVQNDSNTVHTARQNSQKSLRDIRIDEMGVKIKHKVNDEPVENLEGYTNSKLLNTGILHSNCENGHHENALSCKNNQELDNSENEKSVEVSSQKEIIDRYTRTQNGERPYQCSVCDEAFFFKQHLSRHMERQHTGKKTYQCSFCGKAFSHKGSLDSHIRTHTGERPYQCSECDKSYPQKSSLDSHLLTHTGERPYQCGQCDKAFTTNALLHRHTMSHTGERPYQCSDCDKAFVTKTHLHRHQVIHNEKRQFECSHCDKSFSQKGDLNIHLKAHTTRFKISGLLFSKKS